MTIRKVVDNDRGAVSDEGSSGRMNKEINNQKYLKGFVWYRDNVSKSNNK